MEKTTENPISAQFKPYTTSKVTYAQKETLMT